VTNKGYIFPILRYLNILSKSTKIRTKYFQMQVRSCTAVPTRFISFGLIKICGNGYSCDCLLNNAVSTQFFGSYKVSTVRLVRK
jgi:hypothetical protein